MVDWKGGVQLCIGLNWQHSCEVGVVNGRRVEDVQPLPVSSRHVTLPSSKVPRYPWIPLSFFPSQLLIIT
jgi:hypothetical protein